MNLAPLGVGFEADMRLGQRQRSTSLSDQRRAQTPAACAGVVFVLMVTPRT
jgi:hypothetical protein